MQTNILNPTDLKPDLSVWSKTCLSSVTWLYLAWSGLRQGCMWSPPLTPGGQQKTFISPKRRSGSRLTSTFLLGLKFGADKVCCWWIRSKVTGEIFRKTRVFLFSSCLHLSLLSQVKERSESSSHCRQTVWPKISRYVFIIKSDFEYACKPDL